MLLHLISVLPQTPTHFVHFRPLLLQLLPPHRGSKVMNPYYSIDFRRNLSLERSVGTNSDKGLSFVYELGPGESV
jgi:hypothetical protein